MKKRDSKKILDPPSNVQRNIYPEFTYQQPIHRQREYKPPNYPPQYQYRPTHQQPMHNLYEHQPQRTIYNQHYSPQVYSNYYDYQRDQKKSNQYYYYKNK